jgi:tetratricopeptide (TPR) repeat protein
VDKSVRLSLLAFTLAVLTAGGPRATPPAARPAEAVADSLFDAAAYDTLLAFAGRQAAIAEARGDRVRFGHMVFQRGRARLMLHRPGGPADFDRALSIAVAEKDTTGWMAALGLKGMVASMSARYQDAIALNRERLRLALRARNRRSEAWARLHLAYSNLALERLDVAQSEYREAAQAFRDVDRPREELSALVGLGMVAVERGRFDDAVRA